MPPAVLGAINVHGEVLVLLDTALLLGDPDPGRAQRATEAMLQMRRIDVTTIREAADRVPA